MKGKIHNLANRQTDRVSHRKSGIELLKIIAIILIVISHVVQTLSSDNSYISYSDYVLNLSVATTNIQHFILILFRYFGVWGNAIFFVCSAWFLLGSSKFNKKKWLFIVVEVWLVSIVILIITYIIRQGNITKTIIVKCLFPTIFSNNWYLTCYLLFYPIHPLLNSIINRMNKIELFRISTVLFVLYFCLGSLKGDWFFPSQLIFWIAIYFLIAYIQFYMQDFCNNTKKNIALFFIGAAGFIFLEISTNYMGLHFSIMNDKMLRWLTNRNPFILAMSIAMLNVFRQFKFSNGLVNYISSLSLLIYIIHDNLILRTYFRPTMVNYIYENYGYQHIVAWIFVLASVVFLFGTVVAVIYDKTIRNLTRSFSEKIFPLIRRIYLRLESTILKYK